MLVGCAEAEATMLIIEHAHETLNERFAVIQSVDRNVAKDGDPIKNYLTNARGDRGDIRMQALDNGIANDNPPDRTRVGIIGDLADCADDRGIDNQLPHLPADLERDGRNRRAGACDESGPFATRIESAVPEVDKTDWTPSTMRSVHSSSP